MILKLIAVGILTVVFQIEAADTEALIDPSRYPKAERNESVQDIYIKTFEIVDPYRWLEDIDSEETKKFIQAETALTEEYMQKCKYRDVIKARYAELWSIEKFDGPFRKGDQFFSYRGTDADKQDILYVHDEPIADGREFLDPNKLGDSVKLHKLVSAFSEDGTVFAYVTSKSDSTSNAIQFKTSDKTLDSKYSEKLVMVSYSKVTWLKNDGVFYSSKGNSKGDSSASSTNKLEKLYYHILGTDQNNDILVAEFQNYSDYSISSQISDDGVYLIVTLSQDSKNLVYVIDLNEIKYQIKEKMRLTPIVSEMEAKYEFVTNIGTQFIFRTNKNAHYYKLVSVDVTKAGSWKTMIHEEYSRILDWAKPASDKYIVLSYIAEDIRSILQLHDAVSGTKLTTLELDIGAVKAESFYYNKKNNDIYFEFESFFTPGIIYRYDLSNPSSTKPQKVKEITVPNFDPSLYTAEFATFYSKDSINIPMYIVRKKEIKYDGNNFTFMTANGTFGISTLPYFSVNRIVILKNFDGIHVVPNIRGGGEKGEDWHKAGSRNDKQKSMYDFQGAAEYLIQKKYTSTKLLAVDGGSTGTSGPLIGASLNQRPDLFGAVIAEATLTDMLRYDRFDIGRNWVSEYGSSKVEADFQYLMAYSPLHNVVIDKKQYPATMILTATHDSRVPALHSLKFIATLQNEAKKKSLQKNPLIIKMSKSGMTSLEEAAEIASFIALNIGIEFKP